MTKPTESEEPQRCGGTGMVSYWDGSAYAGEVCRGCVDCDWQDDEDPYCQRCDNKGTIIVCCDDMCRGAGECMHGDGEIICPDCKGANCDF